MSNPRAWRGKGRTTTPNSRQKRNKLFLDAHPICQRCGQRPSDEAHHQLRIGHPLRNLWQHMLALCIHCHIEEHKPKPQPRPNWSLLLIIRLGR